LSVHEQLDRCAKYRLYPPINRMWYWWVPTSKVGCMCLVGYSKKLLRGMDRCIKYHYLTTFCVLMSLVGWVCSQAGWDGCVLDLCLMCMSIQEPHPLKECQQHSVSIRTRRS
jgi:hypothetical protein